MKMKYYILSLVTMAVCSSAVFAKVDLVTLPERDSVQITIYNSSDLTLVRESRPLTLKKGINKLQFSWANTLIDPTSLEMKPLAQADQIDIFDLSFPPRVKNLGLWNVQSGVSGMAPMEITFMTSGISWRAFYMGTLTPDEKTMRLQGYVRVTNNSGEDYKNAQTRLIVGKVNILDQIAALAKQQYPYGRPGVTPRTVGYRLNRLRGEREELLEDLQDSRFVSYTNGKAERAKEIVKEGLSEYFLYTIEGTETIPNGWSKRLPSFDTDEIPVVNLYKYEQERYGNSVVRFLSFTNDEEHKLGETPIPGGLLKVYRTEDQQEHLSYAGQSNFKYIPVNEEVELNLGAVQNVVVEPKLMDYRTANYLFDQWGNIAGWDEIRTFQITVKNTRDLPIKVEIKRNFNTNYWEMTRQGQFDQYEKYDRDTAEFTLQLEPRSKKVFTYILTTYHGTRQSAWRESGQQ
jgi:hypothetical protein